MWKRIGRVRPEYLAGKQLFLLHDNAPPHKTKKVNESLMKKRISIINHPRYSPDLSPCDYFLFPKLKTKMKGAFYDDIPVIQAGVTEVLKNIPINDIKSMHALVDRSKRCIESNGTYFESIITFKDNIMCILFYIQKVLLFLGHTVYERNCILYINDIVPHFTINDTF